MDLNELIVKIENNSKKTIIVPVPVVNGIFDKSILATYYIQFKSSLSGKLEKRRVNAFEHPLTESSFLTREELKKKRYKEKTGYENPSQNPDIKKSKINTCLKNFGVEYPQQSKEIQLVLKNNNLEKYGFDNVAKIPEIRRKMEKTCLEKYGVKNPNQSKEFRKTTKLSCVKKYGVECSLLTQENKNKSLTTLKKHFGENYSLLAFRGEHKTFKDVKEHFAKNKLVLIDEISNEVGINEYYVKNGILKIKCFCGEEYELAGANSYLKTKGCYKHYQNFVSLEEKEVIDYISSLGFNCEKHRLKDTTHIDIFIKEKMTGFEFDGLYWHSQKTIENKRKKDPIWYHSKKTELAKEEGITLYHIFEDEWIYKEEIVKEKIKNILGVPGRKEYARNTKIFEIDSSIKNAFLELYHIQGKNYGTINLGAFLEEELVGVMSFNKPRVEKEENIWELGRFAASCSVAGLASKMISFFVKNYSVKKITSFSDKRWSAGNMYKKIGFNYLYTTYPSYWYFDKAGRRYHKTNFKKELIKNKMKLYEEEKSEYENMLMNGWDRIWDCGLDKWEMKI